MQRNIAELKAEISTAEESGDKNVGELKTRLSELNRELKEEYARLVREEKDEKSKTRALERASDKALKDAVNK